MGLEGIQAQAISFQRPAVKPQQASSKFPATIEQPGLEVSPPTLYPGAPPDEGNGTFIKALFQFRGTPDMFIESGFQGI